MEDSTAFVGAVEQMQAPALYLVGGFDEPSGISNAVCRAVLDMAHKATGQRRVELRLACIGTANTVQLDQGSSAPASRHLAVDCTTGIAYPACFEDRGPELPRRFSYSHCYNPTVGLLQVASQCGRQLHLPGFNAQLPYWHVHHIASLLSLDDSAFLLKTSTSPKCERETYVGDVRSAFLWLLDTQSMPQQPSLTFAWSQAAGRWTVLPGIEALATAVQRWAI